MKIAAYVHPLPQALGPNFAYGWFEILAKLLQVLRRDAGCECMIIGGSWPYRWARETGRAQLLRGLHTVELDEIWLYRKIANLGVQPTALDQLAYESDQRHHPALQMITEELSRQTRDFKPDVIISFAIQIDFLANLWPDALRLHVETGPFSRNPYPFSLFFDHLGMYGRSIVARAGKQLHAYAPTNDALGLVRAFRARNALAIDAIDPFRSIDYRKRFDKLVLLPLQVSGYYSFDGQASYRTQFEYLLDVLSASPRDVGVIVTEYLEWGQVLKGHGSAENLAYLKANFPNFIFLDRCRDYSSPSQFLVPRVDAAWSVSSNVGYQALLYNRLLGSPATSHLAAIAHTTQFGSFFATLSASNSVNNDQALAWLLERYLVPEALLSDGPWLRDYFAQRIQSAAATADSMNSFVPIAEPARLREAWVARAPIANATRYSQRPNNDAIESQTLKESLDAVLRSRSWRVTAPLRACSAAVRSCRDSITSQASIRQQRQRAATELKLD